MSMSNEKAIALCLKHQRGSGENKRYECKAKDVKELKEAILFLFEDKNAVCYYHNINIV